MPRNRLRILHQNVWDDLEYLAQVEVDVSNSTDVTELLARTRALARLVLDSPRTQLQQQLNDLQQQHEEAMTKLVSVTQDLENSRAISVALARTSGTVPGDGTNEVGVARPKLAEISDPPKFSGNRKELRHFIAQLRIKLHGNATSFPTLQHRLSYAVGRLEGVAFGQVLPYIENDSVNLESIDALIQILEDAFGDPDRIATATRELKNLRQANREFSLYFADFQRLAAELDWNEAAKRHALQSGLSEEIKAALAVVGEAEGYADYIRQLQKMDNRLRAHQADIKKKGTNIGTGTSKGVGQARQSSASTGTQGTVHPTQTGSGYYGPAPMDLSSGKNHITLEEKATRMKEGRCFYCGGLGHLAKDCPNKAKGMRGSAATMVGDGDPGVGEPSAAAGDSGKD